MALNLENSYKGKKGVIYIYDCIFRKENPQDIVKWCRKNFGERGVGWDFMLTNGRVTLEIWDSKYISIYELWKYNV